MPALNTVKQLDTHSYYHVYNRGVDKRPIFIDALDYHVFKSLLDRYLGPNEHKDSFGRVYTKFNADLKIVAYCLMPNHFHFLAYQGDNICLDEFMKCLMASYSMHFNSRHDRKGRLYETTYKARTIASPEDLINIANYIHENPINLVEDIAAYEHSSLLNYKKGSKLTWLTKNPGLKADEMTRLQGETLQNTNASSGLS